LKFTAALISLRLADDTRPSAVVPPFSTLSV